MKVTARCLTCKDMCETEIDWLEDDGSPVLIICTECFTDLDGDKKEDHGIQDPD